MAAPELTEEQKEGIRKHREEQAKIVAKVQNDLKEKEKLRKQKKLKK